MPPDPSERALLSDRRTSPDPTHEAAPRTKTGSAYTTDDGQHVPEHTLYTFDCSCGRRGGVWYASEDRARRSWERHTHA